MGGDIDRPWAAAAFEVAEAFGVDPKHGLTNEEAERRRRRYGENRLREAARRGAGQVLVAQLKSVIVGLLVVAGAASFAFGRPLEGAAVVLVIVFNTAVGFVTELRAVRSMEALRTMGDVEATVRRDGSLVRISARQLVPGDLLVVEGGDVITADARIVVASRLRVDESTLTGESVPVDKSPAPAAPESGLYERTCMLHKGTSITRGAADAVVVATGMATELGRISALVEEADQEDTPLEKRLERLGQQLMFTSLGFATFIAITGLITGRELLVVVETAVALAVATVPEGLPIVATMALARGMWRMAKRNALVERLSAVETLGSTSVVLTDKTGTLTENRMRVVSFALHDGDVEAAAADPALQPNLAAAVEIGVLCTDASLGARGSSAVGDPMEVALLSFAEGLGVTRSAKLSAHPELREEAFDPELKMMATYHGGPTAASIAVKGAPEAVLAVSTRVATGDGDVELDEASRRHWRERSDALARDGLRVLALARRTGARVDDPPYEDLTLVGLVALLDPPRATVRTAIDACRAAGMRVIMATGDQGPTAMHVARSVHLVEPGAGDAGLIHARDIGPIDTMGEDERRRLAAASVVARTSPAQKLELIALHQRAGAVVAMIGDGVNDAPAIRRADIGVAMGKRGTQVAREAADMVLLDDELGTIVAAVEQGRVIFGNIRAFVVYLLSCNLSEILVIGLASLASAPLPLLPLQILFLNLVTDVFPALALGVGRGEPDVMTRRPRPRSEPVLTRRHWLSIAWGGVLITTAVLGAFWLSLSLVGDEEPVAVTIAFLTLGFAQLWHVFDTPDPRASPFRNEVTRNPHVWGAVILCIALLVGAVYAPGATEVLGTRHLEPDRWALVLGASLLPPVVTWLVRMVRG